MHTKHAFKFDFKHENNLAEHQGIVAGIIMRVKFNGTPVHMKADIFDISESERVVGKSSALLIPCKREIHKLLSKVEGFSATEPIPFYVCARNRGFSFAAGMPNLCVCTKMKIRIIA